MFRIRSSNTPYQSSLRPIINAAVGLLSAARLLPNSLEFDEIVRAATFSAGSDDFGGDDWSEPLGLLLEGYSSSAKLTDLGRIVARHLVVSLLSNRLRMVERAQTLGDLPEVIEPVFILGLPRTGSTMLHELLGLHPSFQTPKLWQVDFLPKNDWTDGGRMLKSHLRTRFVDLISPGFSSIHRLGALLPHECVSIQALSFRSMQFHAIHKVDRYHNWLRDCDWGPAYLWHEKYLGLLSYGVKRRRWLLKAPGHMLGISALLERYPDAKFVQLHRHPTEVIPSMASLYASLRSGSSGVIEFYELGRSLLEEWRLGLKRVLELRKSDALIEGRFLDVNYKEATTDPLGVAKDITRFLGLSYDEATRLKMEDYLKDNPKGKHGSHRYDLSFFGLEDRDITQAFGEYIDAYNL